MGSGYAFKDDPYASHARILALAGEGRGRRLLDVGAADGFLARRFAERDWQVTGIERDERQAALARPHCRSVVVADLNRVIPELDERFDVIVYGDVLEHLLEPERVLRSLNRYLAEGGFIIVSVPNVAHLWVRLMLLSGRFDYMDRGILDRTHTRFFTLKTFRELLAACDVEVLTLVPISVPLPLVVPQRFHGGLLRRIQALSAAGARWWPRGLAYQFVATGRRKR